MRNSSIGAVGHIFNFNGHIFNFNRTHLFVFFFLHVQEIHLKTLGEHECDAGTIVQLLQQCTALSTAAQLLLQALHTEPVIKQQLKAAVNGLTDATRDLHVRPITLVRCCINEIFLFQFRGLVKECTNDGIRRKWERERGSGSGKIETTF